MTLTISQRLDHLHKRLEELTFWLDRAYVDLPHWQLDGEPLELGERWPSREGVVTLTHPPVTVPEGWPLADTWLQLDLGGEGLLRIEYGDGSHEPFGLDVGHRRFPLKAASFSLTVSAVARLPFGVPNREARLATARLVWVEPALEQLTRRLELVVEEVRALGEHEAAEPLLAVGERAVRSLDWPSETFTYLSRTQHSPQMQSIWRLPRGLDEHPPGLNEEQQHLVVAVNEALLRDLIELRARYPQQGQLALTGQAHLDLAWLWPMEETRRKARRTFSTAVALMDRYPEFLFHLTGAQYYAFVEQDDPALFQRIREKVAAGQWEPVGGMWVEADLNMPAGESLVRQLLYGQRYFQRNFGFVNTVAWLPDCFGFNAALPQLLLGAGIDNFFTIKLTWSETNRFPHDLFWWEGIDGSRVLAHLFDNPENPNRKAGEPGLGGYNGKPDPFSTLSVWRNYRGKYLYPESLFSIGFGDGGGGPTREMLESVRELASFPVVPELRFTHVQEFYDSARAALQGAELPVWAGELYLELHRGTLTTQGRTKYLHRRAERDLVAAEALTSMAWLLGGAEPGSLEEQWRVVLRNEFHDILPGSSIREVYEKAEEELAGVVQAAREVTEAALRELGSRLPPPGEQPALLAVNPDLSPRPLRLESGQPLPGAQQTDGGYVLTGSQTVPGLGARVVLAAAAPGRLAVSPRQLENDLIRVTLSEDGSVESIWDKRVGCEALAGRGNQLWAYVDKPRNWDAWDIDATYPEEGEEIRAAESVEVVEEGPHRAALRVERRFRHSRIVQDIRLWANSARLEFVTTLDWHDRHVLLKARFPLAVRTPYASFETAFGVVQRPTSRNTSWEQARFEVAGHRFADLSEADYGVALLNDGKYGHDVLENEIGLSLLRSPTYPDPCADEGMQTFTYALYPHPGSWLEGGVLMEAEDLNRPLLVHPCRAGEERSWQLLALDGLQLGLGTLKVREDGGGLVLRAYEPAGASGAAQLRLPEGWRAGTELDLLERPAGEAGFAFRPFQVRSWLLERSD